MRGDGNTLILSPMKQRNGSPLGMRRENRGSSLVVAGPSVFLWSADGDVGELLELRHWCQGHFRGSGGKLGFFSRSLSRKGPQLALRGESPGFSQVAAGFHSSYDGDLRDPLVGLQGGPVSLRVSRSPLGFHSSGCWGRGPHLEVRQEPQVSSPGPTWISGFLWGDDRGVRVSSRVEP